MVGDAYMIATPEEGGDVHDIEKFIGARIPRLDLDDFTYLAGAPRKVDSSRPFKNPRRSKKPGTGGGRPTTGRSTRSKGASGSRKPAGGQNRAAKAKGRSPGKSKAPGVSRPAKPARASRLRRGR
jgi:ATP-dependent RNA helicase RhlE